MTTNWMKQGTGNSGRKNLPRGVWSKGVCRGLCQGMQCSRQVERLCLGQQGQDMHLCLGQQGKDMHLCLGQQGKDKHPGIQQDYRERPTRTRRRRRKTNTTTEQAGVPLSEPKRGRGMSHKKSDE